MDSLPSFPVVGIDVSKATLAVCYYVGEQVKHLEEATMIECRQLQ